MLALFYSLLDYGYITSLWRTALVPLKVFWKILLKFTGLKRFMHTSSLMLDFPWSCKEINGYQQFENALFFRNNCISYIIISLPNGSLLLHFESFVIHSMEKKIHFFDILIIYRNPPFGYWLNISLQVKTFPVWWIMPLWHINLYCFLVCLLCLFI